MEQRMFCCQDKWSRSELPSSLIIGIIRLLVAALRLGLVRSRCIWVPLHTLRIKVSVRERRL